MFYDCWASAGQSSLHSDCLQTWIAFDFTTDLFFFFHLQLDVQDSLFICILPFLTFPFLFSDTWHHITSPSSGTPESITHRPAAFVAPLPWSLSPEHKSNSDTAELRGSSSLMGSQIISSAFSLSLHWEYHSRFFHSAHNIYIFSEPIRRSASEPESGEETNVGPTCASARVRLMFHSHGQLVCIGTSERSVFLSQLVCAVTR